MRKRRAKVTCAKKDMNGKCIKGHIYVGEDLVGSSVHIVTKEDMEVFEYRVRSLDAMRRFFTSLLNTERGRRMFTIVSETWNPVTGCLHDCVYCWARRLALTKLKHAQRYRDGFKPRFNPEEFKRRFKGGVVFVSDMGDLWGDWVPDAWIRRVLNYIRRFPNTWFLFLTKNPQRYHDFLDEIPPNAILGATIETNRSTYFQEGSKPRISSAPLPVRRYIAMRDLDWPLKFISIEPILDFDLDTFTRWIEEINPFMVYVGYDNYGNRLPEPPLSKTLEFIRRLEDFTLVIRKTIRPAWSETLYKYEDGKAGKGEGLEQAKEGPLAAGVSKPL
ncbi:MAG: phage Gp37/Gp68 family protein [Desulfurococcales archaeon]|nr:phage Gp37/Gp68 family protein [Desulfurococcales archaeon]